MDIHVLNHPLVDHKLTVLRDKNTPSSTFRELVSELVMLEAYEATRDIEVVVQAHRNPGGSDDRQAHRRPGSDYSCRCCAQVWACSTA